MKTIIPIQTHGEALARGIDVPEQIPAFAFPLTAVGISGKTVWIHLPEGRLPFSATLEVDLPATVRGIHMSRMEEVVSELSDMYFTCITHYAGALGRKMLKRQQGERGRVTLAGKLPVIRKTSISERQSIDSVEVEVHATFRKTSQGLDSRIMLGVGVCHITACPCTQAYNEFVYPDRNGPQPTHSQRSFTKLFLEVHESGPTVGALIECLENALHVTQDLLKRPDEAEIVMKAHLNPQFAEDAVRETGREVYHRFGHVLPPGHALRIESLSLESIHIHDVICRLETTIGDLAKSQV